MKHRMPLGKGYVRLCLLVGVDGVPLRRMYLPADLAAKSVYMYLDVMLCRTGNGNCACSVL